MSYSYHKTVLRCCYRRVAYYYPYNIVHTTKLSSGLGLSAHSVLLSIQYYQYNKTFSRSRSLRIAYCEYNTRIAYYEYNKTAFLFVMNTIRHSLGLVTFK